MLATFGAPDDFRDSVCGKRCYNAVNKARQAAAEPTDSALKRRTFWHNDGPSDDVSSLSILLDWLTTGYNYSRYRGGDEQNGETKTALAHDIIRLMVQNGIKTPRTARDVITKIGTFESTFRTASDWLAATGQGVTDAQSIRTAILSRCPQYYELEPIMLNRPSIRPLLLNTDENADKSNEDTDSNDEGSSDEESKLGSTPSKSPQSCSKTIPISVVQRPARRPAKNEFSPHLELARVKQAKLEQERELQLMELEVKKRQISLQEQEFEVNKKKCYNEERIAAARVQEAEAKAAKLRHEAQYWQQQNKIELLRQRKHLLDEGIASEDIDLLLPLSASL